MTGYPKQSKAAGKKGWIGLILAANVSRAFRDGFGLGPGFERQSHFPGACERAADISVFRAGVERDHPVAVLAVGLVAVADSLRPLAEYLRAFRAFDSYFFVDHEMPLSSMRGSLLSMV
jgi:hypothetical protein